MINPVKIGILPIGKFESHPIRLEVEAMIRVLSDWGAILSVGEAVATEEEARQAALKVLDDGPELLLLIPTRGLSAPIMEAAGRMSQTPCLIWPIAGRFALPSSTLAVGALREAGLPVELFYAPADQSGSSEILKSTVKAAAAYSRLRQSRIGVVGSLFPNLVSCRYDPRIVESRLGMKLLSISFEEIRDSLQSPSLSNREIERSCQEILTAYGLDTQDLKALQAGMRVHLALKQIAKVHRLEGFATECWSAFPGELGLNPCMGFIEDIYTLACEGDVMSLASLLMTKYLTGHGTYAGDIYDLDMEGVLTLVHCGGPASLAHDHRQTMLAKSQQAMEQGFETMTCRPRIDSGPATLFRFYGQNCDKMHIAAGEVINCEQSPNLEVKVKLEGNRWDFLEQCFGNHYVLAAGDIRGELKLLCKWLGISLYET